MRLLHSFYTEIEKILKLIARGLDEPLAASEAWHKEPLNQWPPLHPPGQTCLPRISSKV